MKNLFKISILLLALSSCTIPNEMDMAQRDGASWMDRCSVICNQPGYHLDRVMVSQYRNGPGSYCICQHD